MKNLWKLTPTQKEEFLKQGYVVASSPYLLELKERVHTELRDICLGIISKFPDYSKHLATLEHQTFGQIFDWSIKNEKNSALSRAYYEVFPTAASVIGLVADENLLSLAREVSIGHPLASTLPALRIDRPKNNRWNTPAHQDVWYAMLSDNCATFWCPMLPVTNEMGPLWAIPGSHQLGVLPIKRFSNENPFTTLRDFPDLDFVPLLLKDDEILLFNQCLVHKSGENLSDRARLTLQMRYNDLSTLKQPTTSFTVHYSKYLLEAQKKLLGQE
jgi:ectoine hydroxylase-related dioxygenase (phytanoyl-CoA dioxygenase family)